MDHPTQPGAKGPSRQQAKKNRQTGKKRRGTQLTSGQVRFLRGLGHHLAPMAMVGREGVSEAVVTAVNQALTAHELVKIKVQQNCPQDRKDVAAQLAEAAPAALVQVLGRTILLYRANPDLPAERAIRLP